MPFRNLMRERNLLYLLELLVMSRGTEEEVTIEADYQFLSTGTISAVQSITGSNPPSDWHGSMDFSFFIEKHLY